MRIYSFHPLHHQEELMLAYTGQLVWLTVQMKTTGLKVGD